MNAPSSLPRKRQPERPSQHSRKTSFQKARKRRKMEKETDILFTPTAATRDEICLRENDTFVGATAGFGNSWEIIPRRSDRIPSGIDPCFEQRKEALIKVARSTCFIGVKSSDDDFTASGTAFFVGPTTLITARHVAPEKTTRVLAQLPGVRIAVVDPEHLFDKSLLVETIGCHVVLDKPAWAVDITILDCSQSDFRATEWLDLDQTSLKRDVKVDLIGYPGSYSPQYVAQTQGVGLLGKSEIQDVEELLPGSELTITHGSVIRGGKRPTYRVSTIGGMSGSPVVVNGKVVGVHTGCTKTGNNRCVAFSDDVAWKLLKDNKIIRKIHL